MLDIPVFPFLITRGGVVIRMMVVILLLRSAWDCAGPRLKVCTPF